MATTTRTVTYEEWLNMPVVEVLTQGQLSRWRFSGVAVAVISIWPD